MFIKKHVLESVIAALFIIVPNWKELQCSSTKINGGIAIQ